MARECAARGVPFLVVLQPWVGARQAAPPGEREALARWTKAGERANPGLYDAFRAAARSFCAARGIPFLDLNAEPAFAQSGEALFLDVVHPSARGHARMAEAIAERLKTRK
jgi:lysophospholipase L1-like esterase